MSVETTVFLGKNEIFASFSYKVDNVEYIKRDITSDNPNCTRLNFTDVLSNAKVFGFYNPLKPLENGSSVVKFIKDIRIDYLNYIVDINNFETNETIQELNDLRNDNDLKELKILLSITSIDLNNNLVNKNPGNGTFATLNNLNYSDSIKIIAEKVKTYELDGVNIVKNDCNGSLSDTLENIDTMHSAVNWDTSWITTFTVNANDKETPLSNISNIQGHVNYTIIQAFYLNPNDNNSAPLYRNNNNTVTFNSLFNQLKKLNVDFTKLIWGFDLSGIMNVSPDSVNGSIENDDPCLIDSNFSIWPWKEIRKTALTDMCIAKDDDDWTRGFDNVANSAILSNPQLNVSFAYEDPESLYVKFIWVTGYSFAGISIANLVFDSINNNNSILKFINAPKNHDYNGNDGIGKPGSDNNKKNNGVIIEVVVGCILFAMGLLTVVFCCSRGRKRHSAIEVKTTEEHDGISF
ncbi:hypothetical protein Glove_397g15 [Diversispora epigaea]|uniref:GH18 domain-containing protein n=1 Tax=Diversispora epigaea TaxID=1348612 RepID=A0A397H174_9GLOM|nr:hypothetical protein Glove_397g15 [Diversispora epigaea]